MESLSYLIAKAIDEQSEGYLHHKNYEKNTLSRSLFNEKMYKTTSLEDVSPMTLVDLNKKHPKKSG